jgi:hypothetical protein
MIRSLLVSAAIASLLALTLHVAALHNPNRRDPSVISYRLAHTSLSIRASSFSGLGELEANSNHLKHAAAVAALEVSFEEEQDLVDRLFHKSKFALYGSHASTSSALLSTRSLGVQPGDQQYFVYFSTRIDVRSLVALQKVTGGRVIAHVQGGLYVAIGGEGFAAQARQFLGVAWVQEREASSKIGSKLQRVLKGTAAMVKGQSIPSRQPWRRSSCCRMLVRRVWSCSCGCQGGLP